MTNRGGEIKENDKVVYLAEIKTISQRKTTSLDNIYQTVFVTDNPQVLDLGKLPPDTLIKVTVEIANG